MPFMELVFLEGGRVLRPCGVDDLEAVSGMVLTEAQRSIADDFDESGWRDFEDYLSPDQLLKRLVTGSKALVVQEADEEISGYIEVLGPQILLLFVARNAQGSKLASRLLERIRETLDLSELCVNASSEGYGFYREHNFEPIAEWKREAGVKFRPMRWQKAKGEKKEKKPD